MGENEKKSWHPGGGHFNKKKWNHHKKKHSVVDKPTARKFLGGTTSTVPDMVNPIVL
jgi:hypothetical protein